MNRAALLAVVLLTACQGAPQKARKIMAPVAKAVSKVEASAAKAGGIAERQERIIIEQATGIARARGSVKEAATIAARMSRQRPDGDTARLALSLRIAESQLGGIEAANGRLADENQSLRLTVGTMGIEITDLRGKLDTAQDKVAVGLSSGESWKKWAWRWFWAFTGLLGLVIALRAFKAYLKTVPLIGPLIDRLLP